MKPTTVSFFGNFGTHNLGNEYTLQAIIHNARRHLPGASVNCICSNPQEASAEHDVPAFPISPRLAPAPPLTAQRARNVPIVRFLRRLFVRLPLELLQWLKAFRTLRGTSMLVMTGTGMLGDFGIRPLGLHYEILKWSIVAKLRRSKLLFVSVGAGPIDHPLSRWIVRLAISMADYRSYRDRFSKSYLAGIGFDSQSDLVYPDLAFSLPPETNGAAKLAGSSRVVGLGLMDYYGKSCSPQHGQSTYRDYIDKVTSFVAWLLDREYSVRLLVGDLAYDKRVKGDVIATLQERGVKYREGQVIDEPISSVEQLIAQLAATDMVVASRFHNIVLALMLNKPVVALSYHEKIASLMAGMGMAEYCQSIDPLDLGRLTERFIQLERNRDLLKPLIARRVEDYRRALDDQYALIFDHLPRGRAVRIGDGATEARGRSRLTTGEC